MTMFCGVVRFDQGVDPVGKDDATEGEQRAERIDEGQKDGHGKEPPRAKAEPQGVDGVNAARRHGAPAGTTHDVVYVAINVAQLMALALAAAGHRRHRSEARAGPSSRAAIIVVTVAGQQEHGHVWLDQIDVAPDPLDIGKVNRSGRRHQVERHLALAIET